MAQNNTPLTKNEVQKYPTFTNHEDAATYLKEKYGEDFRPYRKPLMHEKRQMFSYLLILDRDKFNELQEYSRKRGNTNLVEPSPETKGFTNSNQTIYIFEDGEILPGSASAY
ncbi:hypothetical protein J7J00_17555 [Bacillus sp. ISL-4]|uniref:hypothetical protein n=1 Tax=Bacillus sp. ISL-4 TaxID=2819125 RepID=UPI001BEA5802|nr:hypothetical protein [Bacillus sp. ISL-4]MBT2667289.1 hypothetical protein [Bacillus sp. ISL-4]MBT2670595.1 hypothetical protein [Streptomyces sp. ISL-14]